MQPKTSWSILLGLLIFSFLVTGCGKDSLERITPEGLSSLRTPSLTLSSEWYSVYFTDPRGAAAAYDTQGPVEALAQAISRAHLSVDVAIYDLDLYSISSELIAAHRRGVSVRVVTESDNLDSLDTKITALKEAGIPVIGDRRAGLMHNKFTVIDRLEVWSGSMNYTSNDAYRNDNNLLRIRSSQIAENFTVEFNEMFMDDLFGSGGRHATPNPKVNIHGTEIETYFSPDDDVQAMIVDHIRHARESIYFLSFVFTADELASEMIAQMKTGVSVSGILEKSQVVSAQAVSVYDQLRAAGMDIWMDANLQNMHNKVILIDKEIVITGSYNLSGSAEMKNDEHVIILHNPEIAELYFQDFQRIYQLAKK